MAEGLKKNVRIVGRLLKNLIAGEMIGGDLFLREPVLFDLAQQGWIADFE